MNALLSIKPEFVEKIFSGEKRFEFRKSAFRQDISCVIVYATSPVRRIVGEFEVEEILQAPPRQLWQKTKDSAGISKSLFFDYFSGKRYAVAIKIGKLKKYEKEIDPYKEFGDKFIPPQSFRYL
ncbi:MAG TPA: ASCH domain-containing protein [Candidatus Desulfovibrio intestinigallinarum]|nr:ASCH domain-containing protein [Candidatus Desulfovibrio intestinigallinarum]